MITKQQAVAKIQEKKAELINASDRIWEYAETAFAEFQSMDMLCSVLEAEGFAVEKGVGLVPTAFTGRFGTGRPIIGFLGEYDALSGLNQEGGCPEKKPQSPEMAGKPGHGCGHNMLGVGSLAAAIALKEYIEGNGKEGTVIYYGCPGEEGGSGKAFMAREGLFDELDLAITWHPGSINYVRSGSNLANYQIEYTFHGIAAHAAGVPHLGRSALDAVEMMNIGVQFLREHIIDAARIHYAIINTGGYSPNVVQPIATVRYLIRAPRNPEVKELYRRVNEIAYGAAKMTGTTVEIDFIKACSNIVPNNVIEKVLYKNFCEFEGPTFTDEEYAFAKDLVANYEAGDAAEEGVYKLDPGFKEFIDAQRAEHKAKTGHGFYINSMICPQISYELVSPGSSDVGDVSWVCPTAQITTACTSERVPGHSWQQVACGNTSIAHKGLLYAGEVMGGAAIDLLESPELIAEAKAELERRLGGAKYECPIPKGVMPRALA